MSATSSRSLRRSDSLGHSSEPDRELLHVHIVSGRRLLRNADTAVTVKFKPFEHKFLRMTKVKKDTGDPVWDESFSVLLTPEIKEVEVKVRQVAGVNMINLGTLHIEVPLASSHTGATTEGTWYPLRASAKHEKNLRALLAKDGRSTMDLGEVQVHVWRAPLGADEDPPPVPVTGAMRIASRGLKLARKTMNTVTGSTTGHGHHRKRRPRGVLPHLDACIHVDVHAARGLLPADQEAGKDPHTWTSDPYVEVRLLPKQAGATKLLTGVRVATLTPQWHESLVLPVVHGAHSVQLRVYDKDVMASDDFLGEVIIPLPPRPLPCDATLEEVASTPTGQALVQGWFPLTANAQEGGNLAETARLLGRSTDVSSPGPLGEINAAVSWGTGIISDDLNVRSALRPRLGRLDVTIHSVSGLPVKFSDRPCVVATLEHQMGVTPEMKDTTDPVWDDITFVFAVTELTSDLVLTVVDHDPLMGDQVCGEVVVPLQHLLARSPEAFISAMAGPKLMQKLGISGTAASAKQHAEDTPRYAELMPPRPPGSEFLAVSPRPEKPLGVLMYSVSLDLDMPAWFGYLAPEVMAREKAAGEDHTSSEFSYGAFCIALGRLLDCVLFFPMFAPMRTVLYLQSWQAPVLNSVLISILTIGTLFFWFTFKALTPLWLLMLPFLHGYVSYLIHLDDVPVLYAEEQAERDKAKADHAHYEGDKWRMQLAEEAKLLDAATHVEATSVSAALFSQIPGASVVSGMTNMLRSGVQSANDTTQALNVYKTIYSKLGGIQKMIVDMDLWLEPYLALFTWTEPGVTATLAAIFAAVGLALSVVAYIAASILGFLGMGWNHVTLLLGLCFFAPQGLPITRSILDMIDYYLGYLGSVATITGLTAGAGLEATAPPKKPHPQGEELHAEVLAAAQARVTKRLAAKAALQEHKSTLRHVTFTLDDLKAFTWFGRLAQRAPTVPRDQTLRMAARVTHAEPPPRVEEAAARSSGGRELGRTVSAPGALPHAAGHHHHGHHHHGHDKGPEDTPKKAAIQRSPTTPLSTPRSTSFLKRLSPGGGPKTTE